MPVDADVDGRAGGGMRPRFRAGVRLVVAGRDLTDEDEHVDGAAVGLAVGLVEVGGI
ncbi:hypothetical protein [Streptomyces sp. NPDC050264]|uniref:hypothetical protein n=1 Tax=Streptomyces sp. NPDC050264 TaxID=3155038 RepID=UPI003442DCF1